MFVVKRFVLALLVVSISISLLSAQVILHKNDFPRNAGAVVSKGMGDFIVGQPGEPGEDLTWDFSAIPTVIPTSETWANPEGQMMADSFPNANISSA